MAAQKVTLGGEKYVILPEREYQALRTQTNGKQQSNSRSRRAAKQKRTTKQDWGDVAEAKRRLADPKLKLIPLQALKRELGL